MSWVLDQRDADGLWDLGPRSRRREVLPLSESWQKTGARRIDWTVRVLLLLSRFFAA